MATDEQVRVCARAGVPPMDVDPLAVIGVGPLDLQPLNGLRHRPSGQSNGWYIWSGGEIPSDPDFFHPVHVSHLPDVAPVSDRLPRPPARLALSGRTRSGRHLG